MGIPFCISGIPIGGGGIGKPIGILDMGNPGGGGGGSG
jgi:hypothetical protein